MHYCGYLCCFFYNILCGLTKAEFGLKITFIQFFYTPLS